MKNELKCNGELITINNHNIHIYRTGNKSNQTLLLYMILKFYIAN